MKQRLLGTAAFGALIIALELLPNTAIRDDDARYAPIEAQARHHGCISPDPAAYDIDAGAMFVAASAEQAFHVDVKGDGILEPGLVVTAHDGDAARHGWIHEVATAGDHLNATVVLPAPGHYTFTVVDTRELGDGDVNAGSGCFDATITARDLPPSRTLPPSWHGPVDEPARFEVGDVSHVVIRGTSERGAVKVSLFEHGVYRETHTVLGGERLELGVSPQALPTLLVEQEINDDDRPLEVAVEVSGDTAANPVVSER